VRPLGARRPDQRRRQRGARRDPVNVVSWSVDILLSPAANGQIMSLIAAARSMLRTLVLLFQPGVTQRGGVARSAKTAIGDGP
jgi:hypothetical protein